MIQTLFSAIVIYVSTSIDYLFLLMLLFSGGHTPKSRLQIYLGEYAGTAFLVAVSFVAAFLLKTIPQDWLIGLLGLIPLYLGLRLWLNGEEGEVNEAEVTEQLEKHQRGGLFWPVALLTVASGGDNIGIYIPYFSSLTPAQTAAVLFLFTVSVALLCYISEKLAYLPLVARTLEKYERIIVPLVFISLGAYILWENGTLQVLVSVM